MSDDGSIRFSAQVFKVQTLVDGGIRLTLDLLAPVAAETIVALFDAKQPGIILEIAAVAVDPDAPYKRQKNENGKVPRR